jgi:tRNA-dihydrouridine synthase B
MLSIGPYSDPSCVVVAPMAGVTDQPFRNLCRGFGSPWLVSEMITSDTRLWNTPKSQNRLDFSNETGGSEAGPRWVQLAGADPVMVADAAARNVAFGAQIIDINMGCPAKKVCNRAAGSALLRDEKLVALILEAVVAAVDVPVTLKIRLGWSKDAINAVEIAQIAEASGISLLTVHGRTRACKFTGEVDYDAIGLVKASVSIPVLANGDINSPELAKQVLRSTAADGVMIGRAAQGRPWLPAQIDHYLKTGVELPPPGLEEVKLMLLRHLADLRIFYGEYLGLRIARKHVGWSLDAIAGNQGTKPGANQGVKQAFNRATTAGEQELIIKQLAGADTDMAA